MSDTHRTGTGRGIVGFIVANFDTITGALKLIIPSTFTAALMGWATWFTGLFQQYAPASWIFATVAGAFTGALIYFLAAIAREKVQLIRFRNNIFNFHQVNPLAILFRDQRIRMVDLAPPVGAVIENRTFMDCEILGPANVMFEACHFQGNAGEVVDAIIIRPGLYPRNGFGFRNCTFQRCKFYHITFMVPEPDHHIFTSHKGLNWITEQPNQPVLPTRPPEEPEPKTNGQESSAS